MFEQIISIIYVLALVTSIIFFLKSLKINKILKRESPTETGQIITTNKFNKLVTYQFDKLKKSKMMYLILGYSFLLISFIILVVAVSV